MAHRGKNEGSISKRENGTYRAQVTIENGKRVSATFKTKTEAQKWIRDQSIKLERGFDFQGSKITMAEYLPQWLENSSTTLRNKTTLNYSRTMNRHIIPNLGKVALKDLTLAIVEKFYSSLTKAGVGARTVRICHNIVHKSLEKALRYGLVTYNASHGAALPRYVHAEMKILDIAQVSQFLIAAHESPYKALYYLAVTTGMRQGELFGLKWSDLQWSSGIIQVQRQAQRVDGQGWSFMEPKTKAGRRPVMLGESTLQVLREHHEMQEWQTAFAGKEWQENDLIVPNTVGAPGDPSNLRIDFNNTLARAGIPKIRFHDLRHTAASMLLNHNVPLIVVSRMLGHSKVSITLDIYGHLIHEFQDQASETMEKLVAPVAIQLPTQQIRVEYRR